MGKMFQNHPIRQARMKRDQKALEDVVSGAISVPDGVCHEKWQDRGWQRRCVLKREHPGRCVSRMGFSPGESAYSGTS